MENEPGVGNTVPPTFTGRTVLFSKCVCSGVLLPSTWNCRVFSHYDMWVVTWLAVVAISEPSVRSWSLARDLAPEWRRWQQDSSSLALATLFFYSLLLEAHVETEGSYMRGNWAVTVQCIWWPAGTAVWQPHRWIVMSQEVSCGSLSSLLPDEDLDCQGATVLGHTASWLSFRRAACPGSVSQWVSFLWGAWKRAGRWGWQERHAGRAGAGGGGRSAEADSGTASSRTLSEPPELSPAETPRVLGLLDHRHLRGRREQAVT